jgi:hypothetical protein
MFKLPLELRIIPRAIVPIIRPDMISKSIKMGLFLVTTNPNITGTLTNKHELRETNTPAHNTTKTAQKGDSARTLSKLDTIIIPLCDPIQIVMLLGHQFSQKVSLSQRET